MGWTQKDIDTISNIIRDIVAKGITNRSSIKREFKRIINCGFNYKQHKYTFHGRQNLVRWELRKFNKLVKNKHYGVGLKSKEQEMLDNIIDSTLNDLQNCETSLSNLSDTVSRANTILHRIKNINNDCENVISELDKISDYLDDTCQSI